MIISLSSTRTSSIVRQPNTWRYDTIR